MTNLLVKIAGAFGPSNAGEAQAQARRRTGGEDRPQATGAFRNWDGGGMGPGVDPNSADYRAQRQMSAGAQPPPPPQQPVQPKEEDEDDGGLGGGGWLMGGLLGAGLAAGGKYLYDKYVPMYKDGQKALSTVDNIMKLKDDLGSNIDVKIYSAVTGDLVPPRTKSDEEARSRYMQLTPQERKKAQIYLDKIKIEAERLKGNGGIEGMLGRWEQYFGKGGQNRNNIINESIEALKQMGLY